MFQAKHISKLVLKLNLMVLWLAILLFATFFIAPLIGVEFQSRRWLFLGLYSTALILFGVSISVLTGAAMLENLFRRRFGDYQFVCISRLGPSIGQSFLWSQLLLAIGFANGAYAIFAGVDLWFRSLA